MNDKKNDNRDSPTAAKNMSVRSGE